MARKTANKSTAELLQVELQNQHVNVVLGMQWKRIVSAWKDEDHEIEAICKEASTNHVLVGRANQGTAARIVGHCRIDKPPQGRLFSAAFALQLQFTESEIVLCAIRIDESRIWVCAITEGLVRYGYDLVVDEESAESLIREFYESRIDDVASIVTYGDFIQNSRPMSLGNLAEFAVHHESARCEVQRITRRTSIPKPLIYSLIGIVAVLGGKEALNWYKQDQARKAALQAEAEKPVELPPKEVWRRSIAQWAANTKVGSFTSIDDALKIVGQLQTGVGGWDLVAAKCKRDSDTWSCAAEYKRLSRATAASFIEGLRPELRDRAGFADLNTAIVQFTGKTGVKLIDIQHLPKERDLLIAYTSQLHRSESLFSSVGELPKFAAVKITPIKREDGTQYSLDMSMNEGLPLETVISLSGPVRSVYALSKFNIGWTEFGIKFQPITQVGKANSAAMFTELKGVMYATK